MLNFHFYAFLTVLLWSSAYVFTKLGLEHFSPSSLGFLRCLIALAVLRLLIKNKARPAKADWPWLAASGASGFAFYLLAFNKGSTLLNPSACCVIISGSPIITALMARFLFREALTPAGWAASAAAFSGVAVLMLWDNSMEATIGVFWILLAALLISIYNIIQRKLSREREPVVITAYSFLIATIILAWNSPQAYRELASAPGRYLAIVIFLGIFPSALAYCLWVKALALAPNTSLAANYMYLTPLLAVILEYLILAQKPGGGTLIGGGIILGSLALFAWKGRQL